MHRRNEMVWSAVSLAYFHVVHFRCKTSTRLTTVSVKVHTKVRKCIAYEIVGGDD